MLIWTFSEIVGAVVAGIILVVASAAVGGWKLFLPTVTVVGLITWALVR